MTDVPATDRLHASCVALEGRGVLLVGPPGSGKSDLALRLIDRGADLVADDQVEIERRGDGLHASAPPVLAGLIEIRGLGIMRLPTVADVPVALVLTLSASAAVERLPERRTLRFLGVAVPHLRLEPFSASAAIRVRYALDGEHAA